MEQKTIIFVVVALVLAVAGMFGYSQYKAQQIKEDVPVEQGTGDEAAPDRFAYIERIDAKHYFIDGVHTIAGELQMPTPCDLLQHDLMIAESYPEQVTINFTVVNNSEFCTQVMTPQRFKVEANVAPDATFSATIEGRQVILNLIPAAEGETPDEFELFLKG